MQVGGGVSQFSPEIFLSHSAKKIRTETLRCFRKFRVSNNFMDKRGEWVSRVPVETFFLKVQKHFVEEPFCVSEKFWYPKMLGIGEEVARSSVDNFLSHSTETFRRGTLLCFGNFPISKTFMDKKGAGITIFCRTFFLWVPKIIVGEPFLISEKFRYRKFSCIRGGGGGYHDFPS